MVLFSVGIWGVFFWTVVKIAICVERIFKVFLNNGFKNCFYFSLLMRGFLLFTSKCRIMPNDFLKNFSKRGWKMLDFCPYKWRVFLQMNFLKVKVSFTFGWYHYPELKKDVKNFFIKFFQRYHFLIPLAAKMKSQKQKL